MATLRKLTRAIRSRLPRWLGGRKPISPSEAHAIWLRNRSRL